MELFVTIRGFSYASAWLEKYKQKNKKGTQKSKSLRKNSVRYFIVVTALYTINELNV